MMRIWKTLPEWRERRSQAGDIPVGFVPTMGALHEGHAALAKRCRRENELALVSLFVNPTQFNDPNDLTKYPRTLDRDLEMLERIGVDDVLLPSPEELYPNGYLFRVTAPEATGAMEGLHRPGFFEGVMTVVLKLLLLARADRAYFGEKDFQQYRVVSEMAKDLFVPTEIVPCETVRAESGLALSSRNALLTPEGRDRAAVIFRALTSSKDAREARALIEAEGLRVEYVEEHWGRRFAAAWLKGVRLIDNVPVR